MQKKTSLRAEKTKNEGMSIKFSEAFDIASYHKVSREEKYFSVARSLWVSLKTLTADLVMKSRNTWSLLL